MILAGIFAAVLFFGLILGDWLYFVRLTPDASRYGCRVARSHDRVPKLSPQQLRDAFGADGSRALPHGMARYFQESQQIAIRLPKWRYRTVWPVKGLVHLQPDDEGLALLCIKRIPWSSAILTLVWFVVVTFGTLAALVSYAAEGGLGSGGGVLVVAGISILGVFFLAAGVVTVLLSYRLEQGRLAQVYQELREVLHAPGPSQRVTSGTGPTRFGAPAGGPGSSGHAPAPR